MQRISATVFAIVLLLFPVCMGSTGDRLPEFSACVERCVAPEACQRRVLSVALTAFGWSCLDDCRYECMHEITDRAIAAGDQVHQYFGKWPFWRLGGIQEPASALFSILNLYAHFRQYLRLKRHSFRRVDACRQLLVLNCLAQMNAWIWSTVFHCRDLVWTERLDYFSAMAALISSLCYCIYRTAHLYRDARVKTTALFAVSAVFFVFHIGYLSFRQFDYQYNMLAGVIVGFSNSVIWIVWCLSHRDRPYASLGIKCLFSIILAMSLEVLDFPPVFGSFDAHSLWHLATAVLAPLWYRFLVDDLHFESKARIL